MKVTKSKYDIDYSTPTSVVMEKLAEARAEGRIYVIANVVRVLRSRGCSEINLLSKERTTLLKALQSIRSGHKVLAHWLPIGYQTARFIYLTRLLSGRKVLVTKRDAERIKRAARFYRENDDKWNRRQLRSLVLTAKDIGINI